MNRLLLSSTLFVSLSACATAPEILPFEIQPVPAAVETAPMAGVGDRADDPAIWVSDSAAQPSLILGTNKDEGLHVYDLAGAELQFLDVGQINNVDIRGRIAVASNDETIALTWFEVSGEANSPVIHIGDTPVDRDEPYGACLGEDGDGLIAAVTYKDGTVQFWRPEIPTLTPINAGLVREIKLPSQLEGCVFDESQGLIFIGEETFGIWSLAYGDETAEAQIVDRISDGNGLAEDVEGVSLWRSDTGSFLVASAQGADRYVVYDAAPPHAPRGIFSITQSLDGAIDGVTHTDGLDVVSSPLPGYPSGLLVVQDDGNPESGVDQNFKLVDWAVIVEALGL